jgi:hypothetical protein
MPKIRDFLMDSNGDKAVVNGDFATIADGAAVPQGVAIRVRFMLGEYYLDQEIGVDYLNKILVKNPDPLIVREILREAIAATPDVTEVIGAALQLASDRTATIDYSVMTTFGEEATAGEVAI